MAKHPFQAVFCTGYTYQVLRYLLLTALIFCSPFWGFPSNKSTASGIERDDIAVTVGVDRVITPAQLFLAKTEKLAWVEIIVARGKSRQQDVANFLHILQKQTAIMKDASASGVGRKLSWGGHSVAYGCHLHLV